MTVVSEPTEVRLETLVHQFQANVWRYLRYLVMIARQIANLEYSL